MQGYIITHYGYKFYLFQPNLDGIHINDIAHCLANVCRFGGHVKKFYSVAQHSLEVSRLMPRRYALEGLLHDASEAYYGDMIRPLKNFMPDFKKLEDNFNIVLCKKYRLDNSNLANKLVKKSDNTALAGELQTILSKEKVDCYDTSEYKPPENKLFKIMTPKQAKKAFLEEFKMLAGERGVC
jgi:5'-deoxynucleotidase YfbR-like HD superfamily hydrolase